jgi:hypothetical protein
MCRGNYNANGNNTTDETNKRCSALIMPVTVAARSKAWTVFARSNAGIVRSNPTQGMDICHSCVVCRLDATILNNFKFPLLEITSFSSCSSHYMFRPSWPSSGVPIQGLLLLLQCCGPHRPLVLGDWSPIQGVLPTVLGLRNSSETKRFTDALRSKVGATGKSRWLVQAQIQLRIVLEFSCSDVFLMLFFFPSGQ